MRTDPADKTIFISSFHPLISRNIIGTSIIRSLRECGVRVVLLVPERKVGYFRETYRDLAIEGVSVPQGAWENMLTAVSLGLIGVENHIAQAWKHERLLKYYITVAVHALFRHVSLVHTFVRALMRIYLRTDRFDGLFSKYKPNLVFATDIFGRADRALLLEAERAGIKTVGMVRSWDNTTTKGLLVARPLSLIAPNEVVKEELIAIHRYPAERIAVTGIPHYDMVTDTGGVSREQFFATMGLDPKKKTILFSPGGKILYRHDAEILALLKKHVDAGDFGYPVQFLVRIPPGDRIDASPVAGDKNFVIDDPGVNVTGRKKESELSPEDNRHLNRSILYSDLMLTLASTMAIDGMVYGKPVVIFGFDASKDVSDSVKKFAKYEHLRKFLGSGLITISTSDAEFVQYIHSYLQSPNLNAEKHAQLLDRYAYKLDGKSSERVAECILRFLG